MHSSITLDRNSNFCKAGWEVVYGLSKQKASSSVGEAKLNLCEVVTKSHSLILLWALHIAQCFTAGSTSPTLERWPTIRARMKTKWFNYHKTKSWRAKEKKKIQNNKTGEAAGETQAGQDLRHTPVYKQNV